MVSKRQIFTIALGVFPPGLIIIWLILHYHWIGLLGEFITYWIAFAMFIFLCMIIHFFGPDRYIYRLEDWEKPENQYKPIEYDKSKWNVLLDTHFHTCYSDGKLTIEQAVKWHIAMGFNAFFVTDHDTLANQEDILIIKDKYKDQILLMQGLEIAPEICHINILGLTEWDFQKYKRLEPMAKLKVIVEEAHRQNAVVSINHYPWSMGGDRPRIPPEKHPTRQQALELGIDLIETANWDDDISPFDNESYEFSKQHPEIAPVVGTDVHTPEKDRLYGWTLVHVPEFTEAAIMNELRNKRTDVYRIPGGIPYPTKHQESPKYRICKPFNQIAEIFASLNKGGPISNLDWGLVFIWVLYVVGGFFVIELIRYCI